MAALEGTSKLEVHRQMIMDKMHGAERKLVKVLQNEADIEHENQQLASEAITRAPSLEGEKALICRSVKNELVRKLKVLDGLSHFIETQRAPSDPLASSSRMTDPRRRLTSARAPRTSPETQTSPRTLPSSTASASPAPRLPPTSP
jgi:hypothetical protein